LLSTMDRLRRYASDERCLLGHERYLLAPQSACTFAAAVAASLKKVAEVVECKCLPNCAGIEGLHAEGPVVADYGGLPATENEPSLEEFKALCATMPSIKEYNKRQIAVKAEGGRYLCDQFGRRTSTLAASTDAWWYQVRRCPIRMRFSSRNWPKRVIA
jgi:hypothetical protein